MDIQRFRVYTGPEDNPTHVDLSILPVDRMVAERASGTELPPSQRGVGATKAHPNTWLLLWLWCAAKRGGATEAFGTWCAQVLDFDPIDAHGELVAKDAPAEEVEAPTVDPTHAAGATT